MKPNYSNMLTNDLTILEKMSTWAANEGVLLLGTASLTPGKDITYYNNWIKSGNHGDMSYLESSLEARSDPNLVLPDAQSLIVFALPYNLNDEDGPWHGSKRPRIAKYARLRDYHKDLRRVGERILAKLLEIYPGHQGRALVDSAPLLERSLARQSGSGFIGKNTCFIHPEQGSFLLLFEVITTIALPTPAPSDPVREPNRSAQSGGCGSCRRCQVHCPTNALSKDYTLDARRCLSYWTIEHRGCIPLEFWPWLKFFVFGCDICQLVCPYNRPKYNENEATPSPLALSMRQPQLAELDYFDVAMMNQSFYEQAFGGTPLTRAKRDGLRRNASIALVVSNDPRTPAILAHLAADPNPVLQATAVQARLFLAKAP